MLKVIAELAAKRLNALCVVRVLIMLILGAAKNCIQFVEFRLILHRAVARTCYGNDFDSEQEKP
jgi:hypothetical protein